MVRALALLSVAAAQCSQQYKQKIEKMDCEDIAKMNKRDVDELCEAIEDDLSQRCNQQVHDKCCASSGSSKTQQCMQLVDKMDCEQIATKGNWKDADDMCDEIDDGDYSGRCKEQVDDKCCASSCFALSSTVQTPAGPAVLGDAALIRTAVGYEAITGWLHKSEQRTRMVVLTLGAQELVLSPRHVVFRRDGSWAHAADLVVGDELAGGRVAAMTRRQEEGFGTPVTRSNTLDVEGVLASIFVTNPLLARWLPLSWQQQAAPVSPLVTSS